jgi:hypothetical protein
MPLGKRKFSGVKRSRAPYTKRVKRARTRGTTGLAGIMRASLNRRVNSLYRMIETKESSRTGTINLALRHNNTIIYGNWNDANNPTVLTTAMNPFSTAQAADDPMGGVGSRIGDSINVRGLMIKGFFENALERSRVYYRVMLLRGAKGDTFDRSTIFKGNSNNKMIDQVNNERFTIVSQKVFNVKTDGNWAANAVNASGVPTGGTSGGIGTRTFKMWIPGVKFGRNGRVQYENGSTTQVKFYDYRIVILAYDWYGTPQDVNTVGRVNEMYTKLYYKDA